MSDLDGAPPPGPSLDPPRGPEPAMPPPGAPPPGPPPPGAPPPSGPAPTWQGPPRPVLWGAAHKPGAIPLKPLGLGEIYDGAFRIIRHNPRATVGAAALVSAVTALVPVVIVAVLTWTIGLTYDQTATDPTASDVSGLIASYGAIVVGAVLQSIALLFVTGMVAGVTSEAAVGRTVSLSAAWAATHGRRWRLMGLSLLLFLLFTVLWVVVSVLCVVYVAVLPLVAAILLILVTGLAGVVASAWLWVRVYLLPVPALMVERLTVWGAVERGFALSRRGFWRLFGIALLTVLIVQTASQIFGVGIGLITVIGTVVAGPDYAALALVIGNAVTTVLTLSFITPFSSAVTTLQYLDQRIRHEAYDVELMEQAGLTLS